MLIPYKVDVPMERLPIANWVLMGLTVVISIALFIPLDNWGKSHAVTDLPPELVNAMQDAGASPGAFSAPVVDYFLLQPANFRVSQLVGNLLIHADLLHLLGNMLFLFVFGNAINAKLGHVRFIALYLLTGVLESLIWVWLGPRSPCLGASGAIMGIVGAFLILYPLNDVTLAYMFTPSYRGVFELPAMWLIAGYFAFDIVGMLIAGNSGVAYLSHVTGFLAGAGVTAAIVLSRWVKMTSDERSLLQIWKFMPDHVVPDCAPPRVGNVPEFMARDEARRSVRDIPPPRGRHSS